MTLSKSWKVTLVTFGVAIIAPFLGEAGISVSEAQLQHLLYLAIGSAAVGGGTSAIKKVGGQKNG